MLARSRFQIVVLLLSFAAFLFAANVAVACPTCKDGMAANDPEHEHMVKGYFYSILFMMGMPYLVLSCFGIYMYREVKKARARDAAKKLSPDGKQPLAPAVAAQPTETAPAEAEPVPLTTRELMEV